MNEMSFLLTQAVSAECWMYGDGYLRGVKATFVCQTFDTFLSDKVLPLPVFDKDVWLLSSTRVQLKMSFINRVFTQAFHQEIVGWKKKQCFLSQQFKKSGTDWLPTLWWVCGPFSSVTCCINIVVQTSLQAICLESQSTPVELTCENSQLCTCLCHWPMVLLSPTPHCWWRDWVSNIQKLPDSFYSAKCNKNWVYRQFSVNSPNYQEQEE